MEKKEEQPMYSRMMEAFHRIRKVNISTMMEVSQIEFFALQIIYKYQEEHLDREGIYVSDLAEKLKIASSQTSRMLRNLEERQWISRSIDTKDRRNTYVIITEQGNHLREDTSKKLMSYIESVMESMGSEKVEELVSLCNEMVDAMERELKKQIQE